jgi:hypothetical protein
VRFRDSAGWRGALAAFLDSVYLIRVLFLRPHRWASALLGMALFWAAEAFAAWAALAALGVRMNVAALIVGFGTGMVFTRRTGPLGGAGVLALVMPPALRYSGAPLAAAVAGVFIYQVLFLWLPMPVALPLLPTLRAMGKHREPLAASHEPGVTDHRRRQAHRPVQPAPTAAPQRALCSAGRVSHDALPERAPAARWPAARAARAMMVSAGLAAPWVGSTLPSVMYRFGTAKLRQN